MSFVVVTYNEREAATKCLESIVSQVPEPHEIIVVDNKSTNDTPDVIEERFRKARVIRNPTNSGYGVANNIGVAAASGELVAVVNPDAVLTPNWSREMLDAMRGHPGCAAAECKILLQNDPAILNSRGSSANILGFGCATGFGEPDHLEEIAKIVSYPSGAAFVIRRDLFLQIGGFDTSYFLYHEDVDLGFRLNSAGYSILYVPTAIALHDFQSGLKHDKVYFLERNRWKTLIKNLPREYFVRCGPLLLCAEVALVLYLWTSGLARPKLRANIDFLRDLPQLLSARRQIGRASVAPDRPIELMTADFPLLLPKVGLMSSVARKLQEAYYRAFFASISSQMHS